MKSYITGPQESYEINNQMVKFEWLTCYKKKEINEKRKKSKGAKKCPQIYNYINISLLPVVFGILRFVALATTVLWKLPDLRTDNTE